MPPATIHALPQPQRIERRQAKERLAGRVPVIEPV
jgi:hypothetical protein